MIVHVEGPAEAAQEIANALRNSQVGRGKGGLLVAESNDGEARYLVEKLIAGEPLAEEGKELKPRKAKDLPWKPDGMAIFVGQSLDRLAEIEALVPGFTKMFGPIVKLSLSLEK